MANDDGNIVITQLLDVQEQRVHNNYHMGQLRILNTNTVESVFVLHGATRRLKQYFNVLRQLDHSNILQAKAFIEKGESSLMAVEPFDCSLSEYLHNLDNAEIIFNEVYRTFQKHMRQIIEGLLFIHVNDFFHGNLTLNSTYVVDVDTGNSQIKLAGIECTEKQGQSTQHENRLKDFRDLRTLIQNGLQVLNHNEDAWGDLIQRLENNEFDSRLIRLGKHPAFWSIEVEISFLRVAVSILKRHDRANLKREVNNMVKNAFNNAPLVEILGQDLATSLSQRYHKSWSIYVLLRDALEHLSDGKFSQDILDIIGRDRQKILEFFKMKYRNIILDLWIALKVHAPMDFVRAVSFF